MGWVLRLADQWLPSPASFTPGRDCALPSNTQGGAGCANRARRDPCGGCPVMGIPTAIAAVVFSVRTDSTMIAALACWSKIGRDREWKVTVALSVPTPTAASLRPYDRRAAASSVARAGDGDALKRTPISRITGA